jgi:glycosyltransferase involved in cell wall biosynthesis
MRRPPVTIGLPVYNGEKFLRRALDSLLGQTMGDFDLIISDNASDDATEEICRAYARADRRVRYCRNAINIGAPRNFNRTFELADTKYFKWSTADDFWGPEFLELALAVMERDPDVVLCYARTTIVAEDGYPIEQYEDRLHLTEPSARRRFTRLVRTIGLCHQHQGLIRSEGLRRTRLLMDHMGSDLNLLAELTLYGKFHELSQRLFFRRFHESSSSWARDNVAHQLAFYDPNRAYGIVLHGWRKYAAYFDAIRRAPIPWRDKVALYRFVCHRMMWDYGRLTAELGLKARILADRRKVRSSTREKVRSTL